VSFQRWTWRMIIGQEGDLMLGKLIGIWIHLLELKTFCWSNLAKCYSKFPSWWWKLTWSVIQLWASQIFTYLLLIYFELQIRTLEENFKFMTQFMIDFVIILDIIWLKGLQSCQTSCLGQVIECLTCHSSSCSYKGYMSSYTKQVIKQSHIYIINVSW
jgi:hypothetical protein